MTRLSAGFLFGPSLSRNSPTKHHNIGNTTMAPFLRKASSAVAQQADVAKLHARKADLQKQLGDAKATVATQQQSLEQALISGSAEDTVAKAEAHLGDAERRSRALTSAITKLTEQIAKAEAEVAAAADRKRREEAVAVLEADVRELEPAAIALAAAAKSFADVAEKLGGAIFEARGLANLGQSLNAEIPAAAERIASMTRSHAREIINGRAAVPAKPEIVAPAVVKPPVPTKPVFLIQGVHWQDPENPIFQQKRPRHSQVALHVELAKRAIERDAAIEVTDPRVATLSKSNAPKFMPTDQSVSLDENPVEISADVEQPDEDRIVRHSAFAHQGA